MSTVPRLDVVGKHDALVHLDQRDCAANRPQVQGVLKAFERAQGPGAIVLPVIMVQEGSVLRDQHVVRERWQPPAIAVKLFPRAKASVEGESTSTMTRWFTRTSCTWS
jgi:hypothetical protein